MKKILKIKTSFRIFLNRIIRKIAFKSHGKELAYHSIPGNYPEWFDHNMDMHYLWRKKRESHWVERGVFNSIAIKNGGNVLDLCCGDGFFSYYFYSIRAKSILAVDIDENSIKHARKNNSWQNIKYEVANIKEKMPEGKFDNITWDAAIEHFTEEENKKNLAEIKKRLADDGILSGQTVVEITEDKCHWHKTYFKSKEDLANLLSPFFKNTKVFETITAGRHNLYFYASDGILPFDNGWKNIIQIKK